MAKKLLVLFTFLLMAIVIAGCGSASDSTEANGSSNDNEKSESITLRYGFSETPGTIEYEGNMHFKELVEEETDGNVIIEIYHSGQLGSDQEMLKGARSGTVDIVKNSAGNLTEATNALLFADLPGLFKDADHMRRVWESDLRTEISEDINSDIGLTPVMFNIDGGAARSLSYTGNPIETIEDAEGFKFRTTGSPIEVALFEKWGINATPIAWPELYTSIQQGVVDGLYGHPIGTYDENFSEIVDNITILNISHITSVALISDSAIDKIGGTDSELFNVIVEAGKKAELYKDELYAEENKKVEENFKADGVNVITLSEEDMNTFREKAQETWEEFVGDGKDVSQELVDRILEME